MNTNGKIKEVADDFILYYNDFIGDIEFADAFKHLAVNPDNPLVIEHMHHWLQRRLEALVREEREQIKLLAHSKTVWADECMNILVIPKNAFIEALAPPITNNKN